jgi:hypothetical protein
LTISLISWLAELMDIRTPMVRSSKLPVQGKRTELLAAICESLIGTTTATARTETGATIYLSPLGSADYLVNEMPIMTERGVRVEFQHYEHPEYRQLFPPFQPFASVLDLLFNEGENGLGIIRSGRRPPFPPLEAALQLNAAANSGSKESE